MCLWTDINQSLFFCVFFLLYALHFFSVIATVYVRLSHLRKNYFLAYDTFLVYYVSKDFCTRNQHSAFC